MTEPLGAMLTAEGTTFRVWAPLPSQLTLVIQSADGTREFEMQRADETWSATVPGVVAGDRYAFLVDGRGPFPDPCSRWQPEGVHSWSAVDDPSAFTWSDSAWHAPGDLVIYECHIGTLTAGGTFDSAVEELPRIASLGVTAIEVMPVAAFPGRWNWGYDGVALFAPFEGYGGPDGLRRFIDAAHAAGLAVILDVVYNHFGPDGNYTGLYSDRYLTAAHHTPWGQAINFDGPGSDYVREFFFQNLRHWVDEYHIDGFRFDATHAIIDTSGEHILAELSRRLEECTAGRERPYLIAESHENDVRYLLPREQGGFGFDAVWADDFHHAMRTALTGESEGYLRGFHGSMEEVATTVRQGFLYEGQFDEGFGAARGTRAREQDWRQFVYCLQNHDQVGNRAFGQRLHESAGRPATMAAIMLLLLLPQTPLLFQGQEFLSTSPFLYFTDHEAELGKLVTEGRRNEFRSFSAFHDEAMRAFIPDPQSPETFARSKLDLDRAYYGLGALAQEYVRTLLAVRRDDPVLKAERRDRDEIEAVAKGRAIVVTLRNRAGARTIIANFGDAADFLIGAPGSIVLHSDEGRFGGASRRVSLDGQRTTVPSNCAVLVAHDDEPAQSVV